MSDEQDKNKPEDTQESWFPEWMKFGQTPAEVLEDLSAYIGGIGCDLPEYSHDDLEEEIENSYAEYNDGTYEYKDTYEEKVVWCHEGLSYDIRDIRRFCNSIYPLNNKLVYELFKGTEIFSVILEALGILYRLDEIGLRVERAFERYTHYRYFSKEEVAKKYGEEELKYYNPDMEPTEDDYEYIYMEYWEFVKYVNESNSSKRLDDLAARLLAYKKYFIDPIDPEEIKLQAAKLEAFENARPKKQNNTNKPLELRVARVIRKHPNLNSTEVAKLAGVEGDNADGIVRGTKAWQNRKGLRDVGKINNGSIDTKDTGNNAQSRDVEAVITGARAEHFDIYAMIQDYQLGKRDTYPTPKDISKKLSTPDEPVSEKRAAELLQETKSLLRCDN